MDIPETWFKRKKWMKGDVVSVGDADGFRLVHIPFGLLGSSEGITKGVLSKESISIRLAAVDAPECPNFGKPGQPWGLETKEWLTNRILGQRVKIQLYKRDQYNRVVAMVFVKSRWIPFKYNNLCLEMVEKGYACVYDSKDSQCSDLIQQLIDAEKRAKRKKLGMWKGGNTETPMEYKKKYK